MRSFALTALVFLMLVSYAPTTVAQTLPGIGGLEPITVSLSPRYPRPYDTVKITVTSTLLTLSASDISFSVNGKPHSEGDRNTSVMLGAPGTKTTVVVTVVAPEGTYSRTVSIAPADVALILEPDSSVHPFYQGAPLVASEGKVRLIALPDFRDAKGALIDPKTLSYTWKVDEKVFQDYSGIGKNVFSATAPVKHRDATVILTVTTRDGSIAAQATRTISAADPVLRVYKSDPLLGVLFESALSGTFSMRGAEEGLRMVPYFFSGTPVLSWTLNGNTASSDADLTLRATGRERGTAALRGSAKTSGGFIPQSAETGLTVQFGSVEGLGIFGL